MTLPADPFARHSIAQIYERAVALYRQECYAFLKLAAIIVVPGVFFNALVFRQYQVIFQLLTTPPASSSNYNDPYASQQEQQAWLQDINEHMVRIMREFAVAMVFMGLLGTVVKAAMIRTTVQGFLGLPHANLVGHLQRGVRALPTVLLWYLLFLAGWMVYSIAVMIVIALVIFVFALLFSGAGDDAGGAVVLVVYVLLQVANVVLTYYIALVLVFCLPAIMVENASAFSAYERAWSMARGHRCLIFCTMLMFTLVSLLILLVEAVFTLLLTNGSWTALGIVTAVTQMILLPSATILISVLYINVRIVNEGCNRQVLLKDFMESGGVDGQGGSVSSALDLDMPLGGGSGGGEYQPVSDLEEPLTGSDKEEGKVVPEQQVV